eukprot:286588-Rhodomonas_salina.1
MSCSVTCAGIVARWRVCRHAIIVRCHQAFIRVSGGLAGRKAYKLLPAELYFGVRVPERRSRRACQERGVVVLAARRAECTCGCRTGHVSACVRGSAGDAPARAQAG